jgi:alcohol dehydrogenase
VSRPALALAGRLGAEVVIDAAAVDNVGSAVRSSTGGGAHVSLDALGSVATLGASVRSLRKRGRHVQVGLLPPSLGEPTVPMSRVIFHELEILGSHGMAAHRYPEMIALVESGRLRPDLLVTNRVGLEEAGPLLMAMDSVGREPGVTVVLPRRSL